MMPAIPSFRSRRGFTLTELLVMLGIIVLVLGTAVPAFRAIGGANSVEAGKNVVNAGLVRARAEAIRREKPCGVFFFIDPETRRTAFAIVEVGGTDPDPYEQYKVYVAGNIDYQWTEPQPLNGIGEPPQTSDRVIRVARDDNDRYTGPLVGFRGRPIVPTWERVNDAGGQANPGTNGGLPGQVGLVTGNAGLPKTFDYPSLNPDDDSPTDGWRFFRPDILEIIDGLGVELLPVGVGLQVITDATLGGGPGPAAFDGDRYVRSGLILFDGQGRLTRRSYSVAAGSRLAQAMDLVNFVRDGNPLLMRSAVSDNLRSQYGVVIYQTEAFQNAARDRRTPNWRGPGDRYLSPDPADNSTYNEGWGEPSESDWDYPYPAGEIALPGSIAEEFWEERWLDANTIPLLVNRFSGTLVEAQSN